MRGLGWEESDDALGLNIWWNLNRLRDPVKRDSFICVMFFSHNFF
jgi:hypothetical protein